MSRLRLSLLVVLAMLLFHAIVPVASAQLSVKIAEVEGAISIETPFYKAKISPELTGPGLVGYTIKTPSTASTTMSPTVPFPTFLINVLGANNTNGTVPDYWTGGWRTVEYQTFDDGAGYVKIETSDNLTNSLEGLKITVEAYFDPLSPYITYKVKIENTGDQAFTLSSILGGPAFYIVADNGAGNWSVLVYENDRIEFTDNYVSSTGKLVLVNSKTSPLYAATLEAEGATKYIAGAGYGPLDENATTGAFIASVFPEETLEPGSTVVYTARLLIIGVGIVQLDRADLLDLFLQAFPQLVEQFNTSLDFQAKIDELNRTVTSLRERLDSLRKANEDLLKQLQEYQGCEDFWKQEVKVRDTKIQTLEDRLQSAGMIQVAALIVGLLLGLAGGRILSK